MDTHPAASLAAPPKGTQPQANRQLYEFTADEVEALAATRAKLNLSPAELEEINEHQRRQQALFADMADASLEEQERLADLAWDKMKRPATALPDDAPKSLRNLGRFYERRHARHIRRHLRVVKPRSGQRQREHRPAETRRAASSSSTSSADPGSDSDGSDGPEPPEGRLCEAPWCSHPVYDGATYCKTDHCKRARTAERQRKRRAQLAADWVLVEQRQRDEDTRTAGYYVFAQPATGKPDRQGRDGHNLSFLWRFGHMPGRDPGEREAIPLRLLCQCNGHHIDGGEVGCVKCGKHRGRVYGYGPLGVVA